MGPYAKDKSNPQKLRQKILVSSILSDVNVVLNFAMQMRFQIKCIPSFIVPVYVSLQIEVQSILTNIV